MYQNCSYASQKIYNISIKKTNRLMLFREITAIYSENNTEHIHSFCRQNAEFLNAKIGGIYSYHCDLKSWGKQCRTWTGNSDVIRKRVVQKFATLVSPLCCTFDTLNALSSGLRSSLNYVRVGACTPYSSKLNQTALKASLSSPEQCKRKFSWEKIEWQNWRK
jgi:hypothetical protein